MMEQTNQDDMTRQDTAAALQQSEATIQALLNAPTADSTLVVDRDGLLLALNDVAAARLGRTVAELIGVCLYDLFEPELAASRRIHSERVFETGESRQYVDSRIGRVFENKLQPVVDQDGMVRRVVIFARDITERVKAEREVLRLERFYRQVLENLPAELAVFDAEGRYLYVNPAAVRDPEMREWLQGKNDADYWQRRGLDAAIWRKREAAFQQCVQTRELVVMEECIPARDGQARYYERRFSAVVDAGGAVTQVIGYGLDLTERRRSEEEARLHQEQLVQADKMVSLGTLVSGVAHEVNNPNQFIMSNAALLLKVWRGAAPILEEYYEAKGDFSLGGLRYSVLRERIEGIIGDIESGAQRIKRIVQELRDFARQEPREYLDAVDVNAVVASALVLAANAVNAATCRFQVRYAEGLPRVRGHAQRLEQVVVNLVVNACQALRSTEDGIEIETRCVPAEERVQVVVRDEGEGMPEEVLAQIMDPFFTTRRREGGTGLGLSVSAAIVREHGGELHFASVPGEGTTATLSLPVEDGGGHASGAGE